MARPSDFTDVDEEYLQDQYAQYRRTLPSEKEAFRIVCAKHIMCSRELDLEHVYTLDLFNTKVRYWFQNNAPVKKARLPMHINNAFHPERVWGMMHQDEIRNSLQESPPEDVDEDTPYVVLWNARRKEMWLELSAEEKLVYERLAEEWSENGPDDDLKPQMAERRAVSWMKAVAQLFWQQCRMPIFIYGCFEDTKAELQGATFDTSLLFEDSDEWKGKPTFRSSKDWTTDFRRYFYEFFTAYIRPDLATPESMEYLRTTSKRIVEACEFERTDEGWPLLPEGVGCDTQRRQDILRLFLRELYGFACGREVLSVPWSSLLKTSDKFFEPGMLPQDFTIGDPSKISREPLKRLFEHIRKIQDGRVDGIPHFQFSHYETGPEGNRQYPVAINSTDVTPWKPRRTKKKVRPPTFDAAPGHTDAEEDGNDEDEQEEQPLPKKTGRGGRFNPGKKFYRDVEKLRREKERAKACTQKAAAKAAAKVAKGKVKAGAKKPCQSKSKTKVAVNSDGEVWNSDEADTLEKEEIDDFEAMDNDVPGEESEESDGEEQPRTRKGKVAEAASDESDDEVEEALERYKDVLSSSAVRKSASQSAGPSSIPAASASAVQPRGECTVKGQPVKARKIANKGLPDTVLGESPPPDLAAAATDSGAANVRKRPTQGLPDRVVGESPQPVAAPNTKAPVLASEPSMAPMKPAAAARSGPSSIGDAPSPPPPALGAAPQAASPSSTLPTVEGATSVPSSSSHDPSARGDKPAQQSPIGEPPRLLAEHAGPAPLAMPPADGCSIAAGVNVPPADVPADGTARFGYLQSLDGEKAYLDMLTRESHLLSQTSPIRVQPPLFWASWGHKSPYLPKDAHTSDKGPKTLQSLLKFLKKGLPATCGAADAQRYCLVMGVTLKTIMVLQTVEPGEEWPTHLPRYMETSTIMFDMREPLLSVCETVFNGLGADNNLTLPANADVAAASSNPAHMQAAELPHASSSATTADDPSEPPTQGKGKQRQGRAGAAAKGRRTAATVHRDETTSAAASDPAPVAGARRSSRLRK